eukprot:9477592-Pyramimonas_sp.AAC.2
MRPQTGSKRTREAEQEAYRRAEKGESSGRKWGAGHRVRKGEGKLGVLSAPLPLLAQEDP